ncbi:MAG: hypothetical protein GF315_05535 [candidate division Zixibacteria bacterium]|nr:hypothetical protein [candidate division Zixibacteria bacterium]
MFCINRYFPLPDEGEGVPRSAGRVRERICRQRVNFIPHIADEIAVCWCVLSGRRTRQKRRQVRRPDATLVVLSGAYTILRSRRLALRGLSYGQIMDFIPLTDMTSGQTT